MEEETRKRGALARRRVDGEIECAFLPPPVVTEFEALYLGGEHSKRNKAKLESCWKATRRLIVETGMDPLLWHKVPDRLWKTLAAKAYGRDWIGRILQMLNNYGDLYGEYRDKRYRAVRSPSGIPLTRLLTAFHARLPRGKKSLPIRKVDLPALKSKLSSEEFAWVWVSFWFGLRPEEVDQIPVKQIEKRKLWWLEDNNTTLVVWQPKLRAVMPDARYKRIPVLCDEQKQAVSYVTTRKLKRPSRKTVRRHFPEGVTLYGGRHGFTLHMDQQGHDLRLISQWLGHRELTTTQKYYQDLGLLKLPMDYKRTG
jgi:integrase